MPWPIKVVYTVRRTGPSGNPAAIRAALINGESLFTSDVLAALATLEPTASVEWSMRAEDVTGGPNLKEVYPKCSLTLPTHEGNPRPSDSTNKDLINQKLRAARDAIVARLNSTATSNSWTVTSIHTKLYGGL